MRKLALVALLLALPSMAQAKTLEDLLVEKGVITAGEARGTVDAADARVYWNDGTRLEFPDNGFTTKINTQIQSRYNYIDTDDDLHDAGLIVGDISDFNVNRARLILSGTALNREFSYKLQAEFANDSNSSSDTDAAIKDAYIQWEPCEGMGFRLGQFKTGISRQFNNGTETLQIPETSVVSQTFDAGYQSGLRAFYSDLDDNYSVYASIYNGESDTEGGIAGGEDQGGFDTRHMYDVGLRANILGRMDPFQEGDIDMTEDLALNVGTTYAYSDSKNNVGYDFFTEGDSHRVSADVNVKYNGFSLHGEFFWAEFNNDALDAGTKPVGFYTQLGYFLDPAFEVAARYSYLDCDNNNVVLGACSLPGQASADSVNEVALSLNYYFWKHNLKAQLAYIFLNQDVYASDIDAYDNNSDVNTNIWMLQLSAYL